MPTIIIAGLPGTGKTHVSMKLASALMDRNIPALIIHTDVLKVTLRELYPCEMKGPGYKGNISRKIDLMADALAKQVLKAEKDGYNLIIEGTLSPGLIIQNSLYVLLEASEEERTRRISQKHKPATVELLNSSMDEYEKFLESVKHTSVIQINSEMSLNEMVDIIISRFINLNLC